MKNEALMNRIPLKLLLTVLLICAAALIPAQAYAGNGGTYSLNGSYPIGESMTEATTLTLYEVGKYAEDPATGEMYLVINDDVGDYPVDVNVRINRDDYKDASGKVDEVKWTEDWLKSAKALADYIETQKPDIWSEDKSLPAGQKDFVFSELKNGLYLLTGTRQQATDADGTTNYYWPQPMFVQILNGNAQLTLKPASENVRMFTLKKVWANDDSVEDVLRPTSVDFEIYYGDELKETVTLPDEDGNWVYTWASKQTAQEWRVVEKMKDADKANYTVSTEETTAGYMKTITMTNTYSRRTLKISKTTPDYLQSSTAVNTAVVFDITGYSAGSKVWHTQAGMSIKGPGKTEITVSGVPANVDEVWVKEIYTGANYKPDQDNDKGKRAELVTGEDLTQEFTVSFKNSYSDTTNYHGGVVNKYQKDGDNYKITERQGL